MDEGESVLFMVNPGDYTAHLLLFFENGKAARVELSSYATKTNRKRLTGAYSDKSPLKSLIVLTEEREIAAFTTEGRALVFNTALLQPKTSRTTQGVGLMNIKSKYRFDYAVPLEETAIQNVSRYRVRSIPALGALVKGEDKGEQQLSLMEE
jgi:DNA gyrase subunit A